MVDDIVDRFPQKTCVNEKFFDFLYCVRHTFLLCGILWDVVSYVLLWAVVYTGLFNT